MLKKNTRRKSNILFVFRTQHLLPKTIEGIYSHENQINEIHNFLQVVLLESSSRFGGWMKTNRDGQGPLFEEGPRSIRSYGDAGHNTLELVIFSFDESFLHTLGNFIT